MVKTPQIDAPDGFTPLGMRINPYLTSSRAGVTGTDSYGRKWPVGSHVRVFGHHGIATITAVELRTNPKTDRLELYLDLAWPAGGKTITLAPRCEKI